MTDHAAGELRIALPSGFDFPWVLGFLAARTVPSLEAVKAEQYHRSVRLRTRPVVLTLRAEPAGRGRTNGGNTLVVSSRPSLEPNVVATAVTRMLDLDAD